MLSSGFPISNRISIIRLVDRMRTDAKVGTKIPGPGPGHNAWQMVSTALVLFMTLPGLALFYGGLVRSKNVLSILAMCSGTYWTGDHPLVCRWLQPLLRRRW